MLEYTGNNPVLCHGRVFIPSQYLIALMSFVAIVALQTTVIIIVCTEVGVWSIATASALLTLSTLCFIMTCCSDPGIIPRRAQQVDLMSTTFLKWCPVCQIWRPPRCKHCHRCDNCVDKFDHHCFYMGNCIGRRNRRCFVLFLLFGSLMLLIDWISGALYEVSAYRVLLEQQPARSTISQLFYQHKAGSVLILVSAIFWIIFTYLLIWNLIVIGKGLTMFEHIKDTYRTVPNPHDEGCARNFGRFFTDPIPLSQI